MDFMNVDTLKHKLKVLYLLSAAMTPPEEEYLRFVHHSENEDYEQYFIDNGSGDELKVRFFKKGVLVKGFDHENDLNQFSADEWDAGFFDKMFSGVPEDFMKSLTEDDHDYSTFCLWYLNETGEWYQNEVDGNDGGKSFLIGYLPESLEELVEWAEDYYETKFNEAVMRKLFESAELSDEDRAHLISSPTRKG